MVSRAAPVNSAAQFAAVPLSPAWQEKLIAAKIWQSGCPINLDDLELLSVSYYDFSGNVHQDGEIILNKTATSAALEIFKKLYAQKFPFASIDTLISYHGNWQKAETQNITYGFICDKKSGKYSQESYGTVITLNPVQNPQLTFIPKERNFFHNFWCKLVDRCQASQSNEKILVFPPAGMFAVNRGLKLKGMNEAIAPIFIKYDFAWSGTDPKLINWKKFIFSKSKAINVFKN